MAIIPSIGNQAQLQEACIVNLCPYLPLVRVTMIAPALSIHVPAFLSCGKPCYPCQLRLLGALQRGSGLPTGLLACIVVVEGQVGQGGNWLLRFQKC